MECKDRSVKLGPYNYDGDVDYPDSAFKNYELADDIEFYNLQVKTVLNVVPERKHRTSNMNSYQLKKAYKDWNLTLDSCGSTITWKLKKLHFMVRYAYNNN